MSPRTLWLACASLFCLAFGAFAAPYTPASDAQVIERLPIRPGDPVARRLRTLRADLAAHPNDASLAEDLARSYFDLAMAEGDPRYIGYAEAALRPWGAGTAIPPRLRVISHSAPTSGAVVLVLFPVEKFMRPALAPQNHAFSNRRFDWAALTTGVSA